MCSFDLDRSGMVLALPVFLSRFLGGAHPCARGGPAGGDPTAAAADREWGLRQSGHSGLHHAPACSQSAGPGAVRAAAAGRWGPGKPPCSTDPPPPPGMAGQALEEKRLGNSILCAVSTQKERKPLQKAEKERRRKPEWAVEGADPYGNHTLRL